MAGRDAGGEAGEEAAAGAAGPDLWDLWRDGQPLCDVVLRAADGRELRSHKVVLAASSSFFRALFVGSGAAMRPAAGRCPATGLPVVDLPGLDGDALLTILEGLYRHGRVAVTPRNVASLLAASDYLGVDIIHRACCKVRPLAAPGSTLLVSQRQHSGVRRLPSCSSRELCAFQFLQTNLRPASCLYTLSLAARYNLEDVHSHVVSPHAQTQPFRLLVLQGHSS